MASPGGQAGRASTRCGSPSSRAHRGGVGGDRRRERMGGVDDGVDVRCRATSPAARRHRRSRRCAPRRPAAPGSGTRPASELITSTSGCSRAASARASDVPPSSRIRISAVLPRAPARRVQVAVGEALGGEHVADDDDRGAGDAGRMHLARRGRRACTAAPAPAASWRMPLPHRVFRRGIRRPAAAARSRRSARRPGAAPACRPDADSVAQVLARRHRGRQRRHPRQGDGLRHPGHGEFTAQHRRGRRESRYAGHDLVVRCRARRGDGTARPARCRATGRRSAGARRRGRRRRRRRSRR